MNKLGVGIIGCGNISTAYLKLAPTFKALEVRKVADMNMDAARARAGAERLDGVDGVLGTLLDLVEIDQGWQEAVEASLGEALTAVVVENPDAAQRALEALQSSDTSGAVLAAGGRHGSLPPPAGATASTTRCIAANTAARSGRVAVW